MVISRAQKDFDANNKIDGYYVHGRSSDSGFCEYMAQATQSWDTALQYAGGAGKIYAISPKQTAKILTHYDTKMAEMIFECLINGDNSSNAEIERIAEEVGEIGIDDFMASLFPENLVETAGLFDNLDFVYWFWDKFEIDVVIPNNDGEAIFLNKDAIDYVEVSF